MKYKLSTKINIHQMLINQISQQIQKSIDDSIKQMIRQNLIEIWICSLNNRNRSLIKRSNKIDYDLLNVLMGLDEQ